MAIVLAWVSGDMVPAWLWALGGSLLCNHPPRVPTVSRRQDQNPHMGLLRHPELARPADLCPVGQPSKPELSSLRLPSCSAAGAHSPRAVVTCGPRHGQPQTTAECQRRTAAPSRQLAPSGPRGPQGHPAAPRSWGKLPGSLRGPGAGLGRRPFPRSLKVPHSLLHTQGDLAYTCAQSLDTSASLNSSQRVPLSKAGLPHTS